MEAEVVELGGAHHAGLAYNKNGKLKVMESPIFLIRPVGILRARRFPWAQGPFNGEISLSLIRNYTIE